jgi:hypothetical protein
MKYEIYFVESGCSHPESRKVKIGLRTKLPRPRLTACELSSILNVVTFEMILKYL